MDDNLELHEHLHKVYFSQPDQAEIRKPRPLRWWRHPILWWKVRSFFRKYPEHRGKKVFV